MPDEPWKESMPGLLGNWPMALEHRLQPCFERGLKHVLRASFIRCRQSLGTSLKMTPLEWTGNQVVTWIVGLRVIHLNLMSEALERMGPLGLTYNTTCS